MVLGVCVVVARGIFSVQEVEAQGTDKRWSEKALTESTTIDLSPFDRRTVLIMFQSIVCSTCIFPGLSLQIGKSSCSALPYSNRMPKPLSTLVSLV
jgi:hypothetical protein